MDSIVGDAEAGVKPESRQARRIRERRQQDEHERRVRQEAGLAGPMDEATRQTAEETLQAQCIAQEDEMLGRPKGQHRDYRDATEVEEECSRCHTHQRVMFSRDGTWSRFLTTIYGLVLLRLTRIRCDCGGFVSVTYHDFAPYARRDEEVGRRLYGFIGMCLCVRLVHLVMGQQWVSISPTTVAQELGRLADLSKGAFDKKHRAPGVLLLDGIWVFVAEETGAEVTDARGHKRKQKRVKKKPLLVAWGIWPDTGESALIGWMVGDGEDAASWEQLLESLRKRGLNDENGLRLIVHDGCGALEAALGMVSFGRVRRQRCVFHKTKNVLDAVKGDPNIPKDQKREHKKERRKEVAKDLAAIWVATSEEQARQKEQEFVAKWQEREPEAVAKLCNDFGDTLSFYQVQQEVEAATGQRWEARFLRTTSLLERRNRTIRAKARCSTIFQTKTGLYGAARLALDCRGTDSPQELAVRVARLTRQSRAPTEQQPAIST